MNDPARSETGLFTVCNIAYLPKALVLAESVWKWERRRLVIYLVDRKQVIELDQQFGDIRWIEDEGVPNLKRLAFLYDVTEFTTCIKPLLTLRLLDIYSNVIFLDPDTCLYGPLDVVREGLRRNPILLTPHYTTPVSSREQNYDLAMMRFGSFNLGFFAVNGQQEARDFLSWWSERCMNLGFFEAQFGLSVDQKWVSIAPCFFPNLGIVFDLGLNMAFWNLHERTLSRQGDGYVVNEKYPLVFFHFSSFNATKPSTLSTRPHKWNICGREDLAEICEDYASRLKKWDRGYSKVNYGFDYLNDGNYISPTLRRAYAAVVDEFAEDMDPFDASGRMASFIAKNHLLERGNVAYKAEGSGDVGRYGAAFRFVNAGMRLVLRMLGPNRFANFARLLVYLSSYRQNRALWKV